MLQMIKTIQTEYSSYFQRTMPFFRFILVGAVNTAIDFLTFSLLYGIFDLDKSISQVIAYCMGIINSFLMNKLWTFKASRFQFGTANQIFRFVIVNAISLLTTVIGINFLNDRLGLNIFLSKIAVTLIAQAINFFGYKILVFRKRENA